VSTAAAKPLSSEVLAHANRVHALLTSAGRSDAADRLAAEADHWKAAQTTVVVAGDIKRGKSSLINALIARPDLLPVDADVATAVHLVVSHGDPEGVQATTVEGETFPVAFDDLPAYASMQGEAAARGHIATVEVRIDHPLLARGLQLVDTPGVGGMTRGHRDITMAALRRADLLAFVVSMQEPAARSELEFLADASERIGNVVLVGSRADLSTTEANDAMAADLAARLRTLADTSEQVAVDGDGESVERGAAEARARRLRRIADQPLVRTSAHLATQARRREERGRHEMAAELRRQSGLDDLEAHLDRAVEAREHLRLANLLQLVSSLLAALEDDQATRRRALDGDSTVEAELAERQAQLERAASQQARWRTTLATAMSRLQTRASRDVSRELGVVRDHYRTILDDQDDLQGLEAVGAELQQSLHAAWANLADQVAQRFDTVIAELLGDLEIDAEPDLFGELEVPPAVQAAQQRRAGASATEVDLLQDVLPMATQTFMFGNIANVLVGVLGVATGGLGLLAYGVGAAVSVPVVAMRRKQRARQQAVAELQREIGEALFGQEGIAREFTTELSLRILDAREQLEELIEQRLNERRRELEDRRRELQELLKAEMTNRTNARRDAERTADDLRVARETTDRLIGQVDHELAALFAAADGDSSGSSGTPPTDRQPQEIL
jgi:hypothetical protein